MRKWLTALLAAAMLLAAAPPVRAAGPDIAAPSAILMDAATGTCSMKRTPRSGCARRP